MKDAVSETGSRQEMATSDQVHQYLAGETICPLFLFGDSLGVLRELPAEIIDCCMTSPPYWGHRQYSLDGIGLEADWRDYINSLCAITQEVKRVLKPEGSFWLNIGDTYKSKNLLGIPWRLAIEMTDRHGWILRNSVIWHKVKGGPDNAVDKLRNVYEYIFHFVKQPRYYYNADAIRSTPQKARVANGSVISATGVSGVRYKRQIELSTALKEDEKRTAFVSPDDHSKVSQPAEPDFVQNLLQSRMNWKMTAKTTLVQLHHKIETFEHINKHLVLILQDRLLAYMRREFAFGHLESPARLGDPMHIHAYALTAKDVDMRLVLNERVSTDTAGIATCLGLQATANVELAAIVRLLESKISDRTLMKLQ